MVMRNINKFRRGKLFFWEKQNLFPIFFRKNIDRKDAKKNSRHLSYQVEILIKVDEKILISSPNSNQDFVSCDKNILAENKPPPPNKIFKKKNKQKKPQIKWSTPNTWLFCDKQVYGSTYRCLIISTPPFVCHQTLKPYDIPCCDVSFCLSETCSCFRCEVV